MSPPTLEEKLDQLYAAEPTEFIGLRKQLQGELRAAGMKPEAGLLGRARRPSTSMWAVNRMVRRRPELVDALLDRSEALRSAQTGGNREAMREALRGHRTALADAADAALEALGARANEQMREDILSVLRAASTLPELGEELRAGRLVRSDDLTPALPEVDESMPRRPETHAPPRRPATKTRTGDATQKAPARATEALDEDSRRAEHENRQKLDQALEDEARANDAVDAAQRRVDELGEQMASARDGLRDARARARKASAESARLTKLVERGPKAGR
jgi:hypothetical protein